MYLAHDSSNHQAAEFGLPIVKAQKGTAQPHRFFRRGEQVTILHSTPKGMHGATGTVVSLTTHAVVVKLDNLLPYSHLNCVAADGTVRVKGGALYLAN